VRHYYEQYRIVTMLGSEAIFLMYLMFPVYSHCETDDHICIPLDICVII